MRKRTVIKGVATAMVFLVTVAIGPASQAVGVFARGSISVDPDTMQGCATVDFDSDQTVIVGEFSSVGFGSTMTTQENALVRDVRPILAMNTDQYSVCGEGFNFVPPPGLVLGVVQYTLTASGDNGDVVVIKQCVKGPVSGYHCFEV